jgi:hypothetical protein
VPEGNVGDYSKMPTDELERLLRRENLPSGDRMRVTEELKKRFSAELPGGPLMPIPPSSSRTTPPSSTPPRPSEETHLPSPAPAPSDTGRKSSRLAKIVISLVVAIATLVTIASIAYKNNSTHSPPTDTYSPSPTYTPPMRPTVTYGRTCIMYYPRGYCYTISPQPIGSSCTCTYGNNIYYGTVSSSYGR